MLIYTGYIPDTLPLFLLVSGFRFGPVFIAHTDGDQECRQLNGSEYAASEGRAKSSTIAAFAGPTFFRLYQYSTSQHLLRRRFNG